MAKRKISAGQKLGMLANLPVSLVVSALVLGSFSLVVSAWMINYANPGHISSKVLGDRDEDEDQDQEKEEDKEDEKKKDEHKEEEKSEDKNEDRSDSGKEAEVLVAERHDSNDEDKAEMEDEDEVDDVDEVDDDSDDAGKERLRLDYRVDAQGEVIRYRYEYSDGELKVKVESKDGEEDFDLEGVTEEIKYKVQVKGEDVDIDTDDDSLVFSHRNVRASTNFPLSVDPTTNSLVVTTPAGTKIIAVLPDAALQNFVSVDELVDGYDVDLSENEDGVLVYRTRVEYKKKFLGLVPVTIEADTEVSAEDGEVQAEDKSFGDSLLSLLSF